MNACLIRCVIAGLLCLPLPGLAAEPYWVYGYQGVEVTAAGDAEHARDLAHKLHRVDQALHAVLPSADEGWRPPTQVYAVPSSTFASLLGRYDDSASSYSVGPFENDILINDSYQGDDRYWSVYYGFAGSVINNAYSFRYPWWFTEGLSEVLAATSLEGSEVVIGGFNRAQLYTLTNSTLIPARTLLTLKRDDSRLASKEFSAVYRAEIWFLVHQIVIEKLYHESFHQYFIKLDAGESERYAFRESFDIGYESLDKALRDSLAGGRLSVVRVRVPDEKDESAPRRLTEAEANGRLALYAARLGRPIEVVTGFAKQALRADPNNTDAQIAMQRVQIKAADYAAALRTLDALCVETAPQPVVAQCAAGFAALATAATAKKSAPDLDGTALKARALRLFEKAVAQNAEDLASWYRLAEFVSDGRDAAYAKALLPQITKVQAAYPRVASLAASVASLCAVTGDLQGAVKYAGIWEQYSLDGAERASAAAYIAELKDNGQKREPGARP